MISYRASALAEPLTATEVSGETRAKLGLLYSLWMWFVEARHLEKEIRRNRWHSWGNFKVGWGSHYCIPGETAGYNDEQ
jgi:hypothetical protein